MPAFSWSRDDMAGSSFPTLDLDGGDSNFEKPSPSVLAVGGTE